ncbi:histidyl-tRNA synthetase [Fusarium verticillioides 7600]|uniref:Histidine--tRNA ligase, mitochondrial n=1 Tax=Gibberella moniliformis (strain M3125 / FGSC 7600) TaxID=334819 RepID=W7LYM9_GIBM7|nr:histidyl-tRNA synthetase [Fusarium verticillioides 7600]EWG43766.1 histidyl-tRNA synthetase [Fusarium verticillioides 7600]
MRPKPAPIKSLSLSRITARPLSPTPAPSCLALTRRYRHSRFLSLDPSITVFSLPRYASSSSSSSTTTTLESPTSLEMAPKNKFELKTPKGTKDWEGKDMVIRDHIFNTITQVFKRHGGVTIDTPVFELREILAGKYGEDSKLIYDLADQGGEICSLRYDLTVPFARFLAMNKQIQNIKRYHIAKVYRRDQPAMTKGRMREFYQCDFDIAGTYDPMLPDAEVIRIITEVFEGLGWNGGYTIKLNHRKILDGIFQVCGVPEDKIRTISSAVDKLDKLPWADVRKEMTEEKGLDGDVADRIGEWVVLKGKQDLLEKLQSTESLAANESMKKGMEDLALLFEYLEAFDCLDRVSFDLSLARGLDYYTGLIYEVVTQGSAPEVTPGQENAESKPSKKKGKKGSEDDDRSDDPTVGVGSVAAGGRYDNLVGMFSGKSQIPCVGISFGVDRIFSITKAKMAAEKNAAVRNNDVDVYVMAFGQGYLKERMSVCAKLWESGIKAEFLYKVRPKLPAQFKAAEANGVPFAIFLGEDEVKAGNVKIKEMGLQEGHPEKEGILVSMSDMAKEIKVRLQRKRELDEMTRQAEGLRVVHGIKGDEVKDVEKEVEDANPETTPAAIEATPGTEEPAHSSSTV